MLRENQGRFGFVTFCYLGFAVYFGCRRFDCHCDWLVRETSDDLRSSAQRSIACCNSVSLQSVNRFALKVSAADFLKCFSITVVWENPGETHLKNASIGKPGLTRNVWKMMQS